MMSATVHFWRTGRGALPRSPRVAGVCRLWLIDAPWLRVAPWLLVALGLGACANPDSRANAEPTLTAGSVGDPPSAGTGGAVDLEGSGGVVSAGGGSGEGGSGQISAGGAEAHGGQAGAGGAADGGDGGDGQAGGDGGVSPGGAGGGNLSRAGDAGSAGDDGAAGMPSAGSDGVGGAQGDGGGQSQGGSMGGSSEDGGGGSGEVELPEILVEVESSIPEQYKQPSTAPGEIVRRSYPCYYYTDETSGLETAPSALVLERRQEPITKEVNVYLPPQYDPGQKYPVIYILHGLTDNEDTWLERGEPHPAVLLDNLIAADEIEPVVAVFPNGNSSSSFLNRTFDNQAGYYYFANELQNDLIPFIEAEYAVRTDRGSRAICGFSMGAMQAINVGLCQSLEYFAWFGAFAAAPTTYVAAELAQYVSDQNQESSVPVHYFYNICGESDGARESHEPALDGLAELSEHIDADRLSYHNVPGGHDYAVSSIGLYNLLRIAFSRR